MKPCKHGHVDGALHKPCYKCIAERSHMKSERLHQLIDDKNAQIIRHLEENQQLTERIKVLEEEIPNLISLMEQVAADPNFKPTAKGPMAAMQNAIDYYKALEDK